MGVAIIPGMSGPFEILLILFVVLLLFGAKRLPELSRSLGRSLSEFRKGRQEGEASERIEPVSDKGDEGDGDKPS